MNKSDARVISSESAVEAFYRFKRTDELRFIGKDHIMHMVCGRFVKLARSAIRQPKDGRERQAIVLECPACEVKFHITIAQYDRATK